METSKDFILWLDLETTGSDEDDAIIEVGCVLTRGTPPFEQLAEYEAVVGQSDYDPPELFGMDEVVVRMHSANGLIQELLLDNGRPLRIVEGKILEYIFRPWVPDDVLIPLGGSGVGHFDRKYIRRDWPDINARLAYWAYDVGVMRRMMALAGVTFVEQEKAHRALADAQQHLAEARRYVEFLQEANELYKREEEAVARE